MLHKLGYNLWDNQNIQKKSLDIRIKTKTLDRQSKNIM